MATAALVGYAVLLAAAFGVRTVLHFRRTGTTGWLTPPTPAAWAGDGFFTLGLAAILAAPALRLADWLEQLNELDRVAVKVVGALLLAAGAAIALVAQAQMGAAWRAGIELSERDNLVREGAFAVVRNPFYLGMLTASLGVALMVPNVVSLSGWLALLLGSEIDVRLVEEPHLRAVHGENYSAYARSTGRFVPSVPRRASRSTVPRGGSGSLVSTGQASRRTASGDEVVDGAPRGGGGGRRGLDVAHANVAHGPPGEDVGLLCVGSGEQEPADEHEPRPAEASTAEELEQAQTNQPEGDHADGAGVRCPGRRASIRRWPVGPGRRRAALRGVR